MHTKFGEWLFKWRVEQKLSVRAFGQLLNVSGAYISALETGRNIVSRAFLDALFKAYPNAPKSKVQALFEEDVRVHKTLKRSRNKLVVWARALATLTDSKQSDAIRKCLQENGIELPY